MSVRVHAYFGVIQEAGGGATPASFDIAQFDNSNYDVFSVLVGANIYVATNVTISNSTPVPLPFKVTVYACGDT